MEQDVVPVGGAQVAYDKVNDRLKRRNRWLVVFLVIFAILTVVGFALAIVGFSGEEVTEKTRTDANDGIENLTTSGSTFNNKIWSRLDVIVNEARFLAAEDGAPLGTLQYENSENHLYYRPDYLLTNVAGTGLEYVVSMSSEDNETAANMMVGALEEVLLDEGFEKRDYKFYDDGDNELFVNEGEDLLCKIGVQASGDVFLVIRCGDIASQYPEEGSEYAEEVNQLASAYKEKTGNYPGSIHLKSGWTQGGRPQIVAVNSVDGGYYEVLHNGLNFAIPHYFYRKVVNGENGPWVYPECDTGLTDEEQRLFECRSYGAGPNDEEKPRGVFLKSV